MGLVLQRGNPLGAARGVPVLGDARLQLGAHASADRGAAQPRFAPARFPGAAADRLIADLCDGAVQVVERHTCRDAAA